MVQAFLVLLLAQVAGEAIAGQAGLPLPGVVLGLALLLAALALRARLGATEVAPPGSPAPRRGCMRISACSSCRPGRTSSRISTCWPRKAARCWPR